MRSSAGSGFAGISIANLRFHFAKFNDSLCPFSIFALLPVLLLPSMTRCSLHFLLLPVTGMFLPSSLLSS